MPVYMYNNPDSEFIFQKKSFAKGVFSIIGVSFRSRRCARCRLMRHPND